MITELKPNQVFCFGSNTSGIHGAGAAKQASRSFGAVRYKGEGHYGQSYAIPTVHFVYGRLVQLNDYDLDAGIRRFLDYAIAHPELEFLMTKVGCGLAGFTEEYMKSRFQNVPPNVVLPEGWRS